ncbi:MAG TPA: transcriptional repressor [Longimicrobiales bacterium]|nr:transcriptional repressor [Longimicrobiales bacterium]
MNPDTSDQRLRTALQACGHRFTEQRAAVYRYLAGTDVHPTADEVYLAVRREMPGISLATVYKSLETLVGCGLAVKLTYADESARYDGRTDPHLHARCLACGAVADIPGELAYSPMEAVPRDSAGFTVTGYRLEYSGYCASCAPERVASTAYA